MTTLFDQPHTDETLGVIGERQLVVVQTFYIARLTSHPVAIIPSSFVAVTGRGPRDSNESGKTSFNAAVSLLLGDPEWRVSGGGVSSVAQLLFEPDTAGVAAHRYPAADTGFIIGVFADPDDPASSAHTVWMKLSSTPKYVQVRHSAGVHLVDAGTDVERHRIAPAVWKSIPAADLGAQTYVSTLYGHSPRCLAYVASRGKQRSGPSLLKMDTGAFSPEEIGAALVRLTGRGEALEFEQDQRRKLAKQIEDFQQTVAEHEQKWAAEERTADGVRIRRSIRTKLDDGEKLWHQHLARGLFDALGRRQALQEQARHNTAELKRHAKALRQRQAEEKALADDTSMHTKAQDAQAAFNTADSALTEANRAETTILNSINALREQMAALERDGARTSRLDVNTAQSRLGDRTRERIARAVDLETKTQLVDALKLEIEQAELGRSGDAGRTIAILAELDPPIQAVGLLDTTEIAEGYRDVWEARLHPWRAAVCVDQPYREVALAALSGHAGAILVCGTPIGELPDGIVSAAPSAHRFMVELAAHLQPVPIVDVRAVEDIISGATVVGGFDDPITGRIQLITALQARLARTELARADAETADGLAEKMQTQAAEDLTAAQAAVKYQQCMERIGKYETQELPQARELIDRLTETRGEVFEELAQAKAKVQGIEAARSEARTKRQQAEKELAAAKKDDTATRQALDATDVDYWLSAIPGGQADARLILNWADQPIDHDIARGVTRPADPRDSTQPVVTRPSDNLAVRANSELNSVLDMLGVLRDSGEGAPTDGIAEAVRHRDSLDETGHRPTSVDQTGFVRLATALDDWLSQHAERDQLLEDQIATARRERAQERTYIESRLTAFEASVSNVQDSLEQRIEENVVAISNALDRLNRSADGYGATLHCEVFRPTGPEDVWTWKVTPAWRRSPGGRMLAYDSATNTAQEKLFSIHLVLAALLASPNPKGRVLILDELGDSLGDEHRRDVLSAVANVAREHGITVLGTCQDAVMPDAAIYCGEILYFSYPSKADALNLPTRMFGFDANSARVELSADHLIAGRASH
ncbi:hypothetical protein [Actinoplanes missouriensis]|uniref:hypothetical protein n=1 Tax=Actinoplanes missouriensis TaxID=1866 RepID=UPI00368A51F2